jgi:hypothetical protein
MNAAAERVGHYLSEGLAAMDEQSPALPKPRKVARRVPLATWTKARFIANSRLPQASAFIPVIGYALLWGDELGNLAEFSKLDPGLWFDPITRLRLVYWGAIAMTIGWFLYLVWCPKVIRRAPEVDDYILEQLQIRDSVHVDRVKNRAQSFLDEYQFHPLEDPQLIFGILSLQRVKKAVDYLHISSKTTFRDDSIHLVSTILTLDYHLENQKNNYLCWLVLVMLWGGAFLFLLPSAEVFLMVIRNMLPGSP